MFLQNAEFIKIIPPPPLQKKNKKKKKHVEGIVHILNCFTFRLNNIIFLTTTTINHRNKVNCSRCRFYFSLLFFLRSELFWLYEQNLRVYLGLSTPPPPPPPKSCALPITRSSVRLIILVTGG